MFQRTCARVSYESSLHRFSLHATHLGQIQQKLDRHCGSTTETYAWTQNYSLSRVVGEWVYMWWLCSSVQGPKMKWEVDVYACAVVFCFTSVINVLSCVTQMVFFVCVCTTNWERERDFDTGAVKREREVFILFWQWKVGVPQWVQCRASVCMDFDFRHCSGEYFQVWKLQIAFRFWLV